MTGYRVAQRIGKPVANTYKAIESLRAKGVVFVGEGETRLLRAVPYGEVLDGLQQRFAESRADAEAALAALAPPAPDHRIYALETSEQVFERARHMLSEARAVVLASIYPGPLAAIEADLLRAACRRVEVSVKLYAPRELAGVAVVQSNSSRGGLTCRRVADVEALAVGDELHLTVDGRQHLFALLGQGGELVQAVWSESPFLALQAHNALSTELALTALTRLIVVGGTRAQMRAVIEEMHHPYETSGYRDIVQRSLSAATAAAVPAAPADAPAPPPAPPPAPRPRRRGRHAARD